MNVEILGQFPSPPVPNLPALAMAMAPVMPQHQQPMMTQPPVSMAMPTAAPPPVMPMTPAAPAQPPTNTNFIASFPPAQVSQVCSVSYFPAVDHLTHFTLQHDVCVGNQSRWRWLPGLPGSSKGRRRPSFLWLSRGIGRKLPYYHCTTAPKQVQACWWRQWVCLFFQACIIRSILRAYVTLIISYIK